MAYEALETRSRRLLAETSSKFKGTATISLENLLFDPRECPDPKNVDRLVRIFKKEGCDRLNPRHVIPGNIPADVLQASLQHSDLSLDALRGSEPPSLKLPPGFRIECLHGKHRVAALQRCAHLQGWWTVELYVDLSLEAKRSLAEEFAHEGTFSDGFILTKIAHYPLISLDSNRWFVRLSPHKAETARRLLRHPTLGPALRKTLTIPGLRSGLQLGIWGKILAERCDEEIVHYLQHIYDTWTKILGSEAAVELVDDDAVRDFECRAPGVSRRDYLHISGVLQTDEALRCLTDMSRKKSILNNLKRVDQLIPSIHTLQQDFKHVRQCTGIVRKLILGSFRLPITVQAVAFQAFQVDDTSRWNLEAIFLRKLKCLYLHIMQNLVELSGENPLLEDDEVKREPRQYDQAAWHQLAMLAQDLGFQSEEIARLCQLDPDKETAKRVLLSVRPPSSFDYGPNLDSLSDLVATAFKQAQPIQGGDAHPALTTSGLGEPLSRRCGRQFSGAYIRDRRFFTTQWFTCSIEKNADITSLFVRRSVFHAFWGLHDVDEEDGRDDSMSDASEEGESSIPPEDDRMEEAPAFSRPKARRRTQKRPVRGVQKHKRLQPQRPRSATVQNPALPNQRSDLTTFVPGPSELTEEPKTNQDIMHLGDHDIMQLGDQYMTILLWRGGGGWENAKRCRRRSIIKGIHEVRRANEGPQLLLFDRNGMGLDSQGCLTHPDNVVCLNTERSGFPAEETL